VNKQLLTERVAVAEARMPSFGSDLPRLNPGFSVSITNALIPGDSASLRMVWAKKTMYRATGAEVIHDFFPFST
jgi:hypothetical protein